MYEASQLTLCLYYALVGRYVLLFVFKHPLICNNARSFCNSVCDIFAERTKEIREADIAITTEATTKNTS
jgi:hypothetical protein